MSAARELAAIDHDVRELCFQLGFKTFAASCVLGGEFYQLIEDNQPGEGPATGGRR